MVVVTKNLLLKKIKDVLNDLKEGHILVNTEKM